jgi:hypothetical protein
METVANQANVDATNSVAVAKFAEKVRAAAAPRYEKVFSSVLTHVPDGMAHIVSLREDLIHHLRSSTIASPDDAASLKALDASLKMQLSAWFSSGILELRRITYEGSSAEIVEKIAMEESVHPLRSLKDLRWRLGGGRRCFGFFHPSLPNEPLVFIHVALMPSMTASMSDIALSLDPSTPQCPLSDESSAKAAIFYSINSTLTGLSGVDLGNALIKRVAKLLHTEFPNISIFSTLSPVPGFRKWLKVKCGGGGKFEISDEEIFGGNLAAFKAFAGECDDYTAALLDILEDVEQPFQESAVKVALLEPILTRLVAKYLCVEKHRSRPVDGVAKFHLNNGACLERVNFMADTSRKRMGQSYGMMVNYLYGEPGDIDANQYRYGAGEVVASEEVAKLIT